jgi:hypothetical protein
LQIVSRYLLKRKISVENVSSNEEGFRKQLKLVVNFNEPVQEHQTHFIFNVDLGAQEVRLKTELRLNRELDQKKE